MAMAALDPLEQMKERVEELRKEIKSERAKWKEEREWSWDEMENHTT